MNTVAQKELFLLDMDGTVYLENELIDGAKEFIEVMKKHGVSVSIDT